MRSIFVGVKKEAQEEFGKLDPDTTFEEWTEGKEKEAMDDRPVVEGKDITETWQRRSQEEFYFAIEDIINAQGFDGLPKVVSDEEFEKAVEKSHYIMQRTYSAPDDATLKKYKDELRNGRWYVECSGGSDWGQGMYTVSNSEGKINDEFIDTVEWFRNTDRPNIVESMTFTPDAKLIKYEELEEIWTAKQTEQKYKEMDINVLAAALGYDGVVAQDYGSGYAYTVVLNRTKLIIKGEG
jgi:hypothetical protein